MRIVIVALVIVIGTSIAAAEPKNKQTKETQCPPGWKAIGSTCFGKGCPPGCAECRADRCIRWAKDMDKRK
jgi:hypothetical protein